MEVAIFHASGPSWDVTYMKGFVRIRVYDAMFPVAEATRIAQAITMALEVANER